MSDAAQRFFAWCNQYRVASDDSCLGAIRQILGDLATEADRQGIDPQRIWDVYGSLPLPQRGRALEDALDSVWPIARRMLRRSISTSASQREEPSEAKVPFPGRPAVLTENDRQILTKMHALEVVASCPMSVQDIMRELKWKIEGKRSFDNLKRLGYVAAKPNVGHYLTESGIDAAKRLMVDPE